MATSIPKDRHAVVLVKTGSLTCALPLAAVIETMRPLPVTFVSGQPVFVRGLAVVRSAATPVVDLGHLVRGDGSAPVTRFVTVRTAGGVVALAVEAVLGLAHLEPSEVEQLPPLLRDAGQATVMALSTLDSSLLVVLDAARVVPDAVWRAVEDGIG